MSWQEELRKLDEELASGRLSADDYRVRRDQVLSSAVSYSGDAPQPQQPPQPQQQAPQQQAEQNNSADSTQVIAPVSPPQGTPQPSQQQQQNFSAEPTQAVSPNWQARPPADPERTQYVANPSPPQGFPQAPASPPQGFPQSGPQPQQPWNAPEPDVSPPWGGTEFPPISPASGNEWVAQGPEAFDDQPSKGGKGKIAWISVAVVVVLVAAGLAIFLTAGGDDENSAGPSTSENPAPTSVNSNDPYQPLLDKIPPTEGTPDGQSGLLPTNRLVDLGIMDADEATLLTTRSVQEVAWRGSQRQPDASGPGNEKISVTVIPLDSSATATALAGQLRQYYVRNGLVLISDQLPNIPSQVVFHKLVASPVVYRGTWVSGNNLVRVNVTQGDLADEAALSGAYQRTIRSLLLPYPAG
ncbi:hypothetical protein GCM10027445_39740 [Amycolatopsis endophytica]|uniref:Flagellar basal body-associated protein FliL n=1 Tax=Amycolatopsis endophytica TaxID=860233 RepID=A0A853AZY9_9PSEU|nr:hypothetical protein [Amycolatopsis endophytica]NYI88338.1 hypothetical protein [Amycolatopsis endophytica]